MKLSYYENKVFVRAEGILTCCMLYCTLANPSYEWSSDNDGEKVLSFYFKPETQEHSLKKAIEAMDQAFRKVKVSMGETIFKLTPDGFIKIKSINIYFSRKGRV